jgi:hypothetical protein
MGASVNRLGRWLSVAKVPSPTRRAAALLIADYYVTCAQDLDLEAMAKAMQKGVPSYTTTVSVRYAEIGADFGGCPLGGYLPYIHNFRAEASKLSPKTVGNLADLHAFWERETFGYGKVGTGERLARIFPKWRPRSTMRLPERTRPGFSNWDARERARSVRSGQ